MAAVIVFAGVARTSANPLAGLAFGGGGDDGGGGGGGGEGLGDSQGRPEAAGGGLRRT